MKKKLIIVRDDLLRGRRPAGIPFAETGKAFSSEPAHVAKPEHLMDSLQWEIPEQVNPQTPKAFAAIVLEGWRI